MPHETDLRDAYFAGLLDGEAWFSAKGRKCNIGVDMVCEKTIRAIYAHFGVGHVTPKKARGHYKPQWRWSLNTRIAARAVLMRIRPYLITKSVQAEVVWEVANLPDLPPGPKPMKRRPCIKFSVDDRQKTVGWRAEWRARLKEETVRAV